MKINWKTIIDFARFGAVVGFIWGVLLFIMISLFGVALQQIIPTLGGLMTIVGLSALVFSIIAGVIYWGLAGVVYQKVRQFRGFWGFVLSAFVVSILLTIIEALVGLPLLNMGLFSIMGLAFAFVMVVIQAWLGLWVYKKLKWKKPI